METIPTWLGHPSIVYFLTKYHSGVIKIGVSRNFTQRFYDHRRERGRDLFCLGVHPGERADETALHRRFAEWRIRGEWFEQTPELLEYISEKTVPFDYFRRGLVVRRYAIEDEPMDSESMFEYIEKGQGRQKECAYQVGFGRWEEIWWSQILTNNLEGRRAWPIPTPPHYFQVEYEESQSTVQHIRQRGRAHLVDPENRPWLNRKTRSILELLPS